MKEKLNKFLSRHNQSSVFLWLIVGGYLVYLAYDIFTGDMGSANHALLYIACAFFMIVGLAVCAISLYALIGKHYQMPQMSFSDEEDENTEE